MLDVFYNTFVRYFVLENEKYLTSDGYLTYRSMAVSIASSFSLSDDCRLHVSEDILPTASLAEAK